MVCQRSVTLLLRQVEDFLRGGNHSKHMPWLIYLAWLQPFYYNSRFVFLPINITKVFFCGENLKKKIFQIHFWKYFFFQAQFWKYYFSPSFQVQFLGFFFFFQVQFLRMLFFLGSVLKIYFFPGSGFEIYSQQPWNHKAAATLITNHKL